ncbi:MAG: RNA methyltransferase [Chitinophagales bacterium]|nr:RNA methyltransferase [Chitinophagales bacterium]
MEFPESFLKSLQHVAGFREAEFITAHGISAPVSVRMNPKKKTDQFSRNKTVPWSASGFYLEERPSFTLDPLFHAGTYYVQEASSMFLEYIFKKITDLSYPLKILDLCAAPGGKSTLISALISEESVLISNEVIKSRVHVLKENIIKWGNAHTIITNNDPADFSVLKNYFDVIVVDAPCSGSGLFRKDKNAMNEWSAENVLLCCKRQNRILDDVIPALKTDGILIYSTCSYSAKENEDLVQKVLKDHPFEMIDVHPDEKWGIVETDYGLRFFPDRVRGEGFFISALKKIREGNNIEPSQQNNSINEPFFEKVSKEEKEILESWILNENNAEIVKRGNTFYIIPKNIMEDIEFLRTHLKIVQTGIKAGEMKGKVFIPAHELSMSAMVNKNIPVMEVDKTTALQYLRKQEIPYNESLLNYKRGWALVRYENQNLGWVKILETRINNYYPMEWRIKM